MKMRIDDEPFPALHGDLSKEQECPNYGLGTNKWSRPAFPACPSGESLGQVLFHPEALMGSRD